MHEPRSIEKRKIQMMSIHTYMKLAKKKKREDGWGEREEGKERYF